MVHMMNKETMKNMKNKTNFILADLAFKSVGNDSRDDIKKIAEYYNVTPKEFVKILDDAYQFVMSKTKKESKKI